MVLAVVAIAGAQVTTDDPPPYSIGQVPPLYGESLEDREELPDYSAIFANFVNIIKAGSYLPFSATNRAKTMEHIKHLPVATVSEGLLHYLVTDNIFLRASHCPSISIGNVPQFSSTIENYRNEFRSLATSHNVTSQLAAEQILRFAPKQKKRCLVYGLQERWLYHLEKGWVEPQSSRPMDEFLAHNLAYNAMLQGNAPLAWALALGAEDPTAARTGTVGRLAVYDVTVLVVAFDLLLIAVLQDNALAVADVFLYFDLVDLHRPRLAQILLLGVWYAQFESVREILNHLARKKNAPALGIGADHLNQIEDCFIQPNDDAMRKVRAYILSLDITALSLPQGFNLANSTDVNDVFQQPLIRDPAAYHLPRLAANVHEFNSYSAAVMNMAWNWRCPEQRSINFR